MFIEGFQCIRSGGLQLCVKGNDHLIDLKNKETHYFLCGPKAGNST